MTNTGWTPPKHAVYDDVPSIGLFTCVCGAAYTTADELYRHASRGAAQTRSPAPYRIRKIGNRWCTLQQLRLIGTSLTWHEAMAIVHIRERARWNTHIPAAPGDANG
ncbi:hypothetical protein GS471_16995 [Rhodococcus hoagii]|nr:hypothetical protein [Prescottella equi]